MTVRRLGIAVALALLAGVAVVLALDAATRAWGNPGSAVIVAIVAVWLGQGIPTVIRHWRHR